MADASTAALLLTNRIAKVDAKPYGASEFWALMETVDSPDELLGQSATDIARDLLIDNDAAARIATLLDAAVAFTLQREELATTGITMLSAFDDAYPTRLRTRLANGAPPLLYVSGPVDWLSAPGVAIVGSRDVDEDGADVARAIARASAQAGLAVISGAARGVDQLSMGAALELDAPVVGITTEGVRKVSRTAEMRRLLAAEQICIASPYAPDAGFTPGNAMARNKVIYGLSNATAVVASAKESGGTWNGAVEAIRRRYAPVMIWQGPGQGEGNDDLVGQGGRPFKEPEDVIAAALETTDAPTGRQLSLTLATQAEPPADDPVPEPSVPTAPASESSSTPDDTDLDTVLAQFEHKRLEPMGLGESTMKSYRRGAKLFLDWQRSHTA